MDLSANLEIFSPVELINLIASYKRTGALYFDISGQNGEIYFEEGVPVHAEYKSLSGIEAIYNVAVERSGQVKYKDDVTIKEHTIKKDETAGLLNNIEKRKVEFDDIVKTLPPFDAVLEKRAEGAQDGVALRKSDWAIIRLVNGTRDINTIIKESGLPVLVACQTLHWLLEKGMLLDKSLSERIKRSFERIMNNILEVYSVKGTNTKEWFDFIIDALNTNGFETTAGMLKLKNDEIVADDAVIKILTEEQFNEVKELLYNKALERANDELGKMLAKKKQKELLAKEGE